MHVVRLFIIITTVFLAIVVVVLLVLEYTVNIPGLSCSSRLSTADAQIDAVYGTTDANIPAVWGTTNV